MLRIYCLQAGFNNSRIEKIFEHMRHGKEPSVFKAWADIKHILNPEEHSYWNTVSNLLIYSSEEIEKNISAEEIVRAKTIYQKHIKSYLEKCLLIELHE